MSVRMFFITAALLVMTRVISTAQPAGVFYTGINGRSATEGNAVVKNVVRSRGASVLTAVTYRKSDGEWIRHKGERIRKTSEDELVIKTMGLTRTRKVIRKYEQVSDSLFRFAEYSRGNIIREGVSKQFYPLVLHGKVTDYYPSTKLKAKSVYRDNQLVSNENWLESGEKYYDDIFFSVDEEPLFVGGMAQMHHHVRSKFLDAGVDLATLSGSMLLGFVITEDGKLEGIQVVKGITASINSIAANALQTLGGSWVPARLNGRVVRYYQLFPINFVHRETRFDMVEMRGQHLHWVTY